MGNSKKRRGRRIRSGVVELQTLFAECSIVAYELARARAEHENPTVRYRVVALDQFRAVLDVAGALLDLSTSSPRKEFEEQITPLDRALEIERAFEAFAACVDELRERVRNIDELTRREPDSVPTAVKSVKAMI